MYYVGFILYNMLFVMRYRVKDLRFVLRLYESFTTCSTHSCHVDLTQECFKNEFTHLYVYDSSLF